MLEAFELEALGTKNGEGDAAAGVAEVFGALEGVESGVRGVKEFL